MPLSDLANPNYRPSYDPAGGSRSTLSALFDYLDRPGQTVRGGIRGAYDPNESVLGGAWKGFTGQKKVYGTDLLSDAGMKDPGWGRSALGFGVDLLTDPLSWLPAGAVTKIARATQIPRAVAGTGRIVAKAAEHVAPQGVATVKTLADLAREGLGKTFIKGYGQPEAYRTSRRVHDATSRALPKTVAEGVVKTVAEPDPTIRKGALIWMEKQRRAVPGVAELGERALGRTRDIFRREVAEGLQDPSKEIANYAIRSFTGKGGKHAFSGIGRTINAKLGFAKKRELETIDEALEAGAEPDVAKALYARLFAGEKAILNAKFLKGTAGTFGVPVKRVVKDGVELGIDRKSVPKGFKAIFSADEKNALADWGFFQQTVKLADGTVAKLRDVALPEKIADDIYRTFLKGAGRERGPMTQLAVDAANRVNQTFRAGATYLRPGFHLTNLPGNIWNMNLGGMNAAKALVGTGRQAKGLWKGTSAIPAKGIGKYSHDEIADAISKYHISDPQSTFAGMFDDAGDMGDRIVRELGGGKRRGPIKAYGDFMKKVGTSIEGGSKEALFMRELGKGRSLDEAAETVNKYLFDYSDLTDTEKAIRNVLPFYTWSRKNIPLQAKELLRQPKTFAAPGKFKHAIEDVTGQTRVAERDRPEWMRDDENIQLPWAKEGGATYYDPYLPYKDLNKLQADPRKWLSLLRDEGLSMLGPLAKLPIEALANRDFLRGSELYDKDLGYGQMKGTPWLGGTPLPVWLQHLVSSVNPAIPALSKTAVGAGTAVLGDPLSGISQMLGPLGGLRMTVKDRAGVKKDREWNKTKAKTAIGRRKKEAKTINQFYGGSESVGARATRLAAEMM